MSIRSRIMVSLIAVSLLVALSISGVGLTVSRAIIMDNSDQMVQNIVRQVALNLDERVKAFEDATYSVVQRSELRRMVVETNRETGLERRQVEQVISDAINQTGSLLLYARMALLECADGEQYIYNRYRSTMEPVLDLSSELQDIRPLLNKQSPLRWWVADGQILFARLIVDERTFEVQGTMMYCLNERFLDFLTGQDILSGQNLIIVNAQGNVMHKGQYDLEEPYIRSLLEGGATQTRYMGEHTLSANERSPRKGWNVYCLVKAADLYQKDRIVILFNIMITVGALMFSLLLTVVIARTITRNITRMEDTMTRVEEGDFLAQMRPASYDEIGRLGLRFNQMITQMETLIDEVAQGRADKQKAEFEVLQAQVNPHFLYNTLGSVKWMAHRSEDTSVEEMIGALIELLRASIRKTGAMQTVADEIHYIQSYALLQKMRYEDAFTIEYQLEDAALCASVPGFLLQPLVENALFHGIDIAKRNGVITIRASVQGDRLTLEVQDNGVGVPEERLEEILAKPKQYKGFNSLGVSAVRQRLIGYYADLCSFYILSAVGEGTLVRIELPYQAEVSEECTES